MNRSFVLAWVFYQSPLNSICIIVVGTFSRKAVKKKHTVYLLWKIFNLPPGDWRMCCDSCLTAAAWLLSHSCLIWSLTAVIVSLCPITNLSVRPMSASPSSGLTLTLGPGSVVSKLRSTPRSSMAMSGVRQGSAVIPAVTAVTAADLAAGDSLSPVSMLTGSSMTHGTLPLDNPAENIKRLKTYNILLASVWMSVRCECFQINECW